jgi:hypothetical protein
MTDFQLQKELYADLCIDLKLGKITRAEFATAASRLRISIAKIREDLEIYKHDEGQTDT